MCTKCKQVLPKADFCICMDKRRRALRMHCVCKKCQSRLKIERDKRPHNKQSWKNSRAKWLLKKKIEELNEFLKDNTGAVCIAQWHTCKKCKRVQYFKHKEHNDELCKKCLRFKNKVNIYHKAKPKTAICPVCNVEHIAKIRIAMCLPCKKERQKHLKRNRKKQENKSLLTRARKYGVVKETISRAKVYDRDKYKCRVCGIKVVRTKTYAPNMATIDHIIPMSKGGPHTYENVQTLCAQCNSNKRDIIPSSVQLSIFVSDCKTDNYPRGQ